MTQARSSHAGKHLRGASARLRRQAVLLGAALSLCAGSTNADTEDANETQPMAHTPRRQNWCSTAPRPAKGKVVQRLQWAARPMPKASMQSCSASLLTARASLPHGAASTNTTSADTPGGSATRPAPDDETNETADPPSTPVYLRVHAGVVSRALTFKQDVYERMRELHANAYVGRVEGVVYPFFRSELLRGRLAVVASYEGTVAGNVRDSDFQLDYSVAHSELSAGLRLRQSLRRYDVSLEVAFDRLHSGLGAESVKPGIPTVTYSQLRAALAAELPLGAAHARVGGGFRVPLRYGQLSEADWFPRVGGYGVDLAVSLSYPLSDHFALELESSLRRFVLEMSPEPEDASGGVSEVVGGAIDSYLGAHVGLRFTP